MPHTYTRCLLHCVWSTHSREPTLAADVRPRLYEYLGGVGREHGVRLLAAGGVADHVHVLLSMPATLSIADAMRCMKGAASRWAHEVRLTEPPLRWQDGYGAFSVGAAGQDKVEAYIRGQEEHHRTVTFQEEFVEFLDRNGVEYDPRYIWR